MNSIKLNLQVFNWNDYGIFRRRKSGLLCIYAKVTLMNALHMHLKCSILYLMFFKYLHFDNDLDLGLNKPDAGSAVILPHQSSDAKSLYISHAESNFYGTEIEIWAAFGLVGSTEKKNWTDYEQLFRAVFSWAKKSLFCF